MFLLIPGYTNEYGTVIPTLNSIMFLLIQGSDLEKSGYIWIFKFHYVSINSTTERENVEIVKKL